MDTEYVRCPSCGMDAAVYPQYTTSDYANTKYLVFCYTIHYDNYSDTNGWNRCENSGKLAVESNLQYNLRGVT